MQKRTNVIISVLLILCILWTSIPATALDVDDTISAPVDTPSINAPAIDSTIIAPEDAAPLLEEDCHILRYVNKDTFAKKGHIARLHAEETLSSYVFQNKDGSRTIYFMDEPVKYQDSNGLIWEKDLTLRPTTSNGTAVLMGTNSVEGYTTTSNDIGLTIPNNPAHGIRLTYAENQIKLIPQGGILNPTPETADNAVTYPDYFGEGMSLRYTPTLDGVKEDIILKSYTGVNRFTFILETDGLRLYQDSGRYYLASSQTDETRFELGDVVTFDAHGKFSVGSMTMETVTANQSYRLTLTIDEDFLTDSATTYPVTIDPTITVANASNSDGDAIEDATIYSGAPDMNANWTYLHAGYYNSTYKVARTLFLFPGLVGSSVYQFPSEYQITSVEFHIREATGTSPIAVGLYANSSDYRWSESTVTWNYTDFILTRQYATASPGNGNDTVYDITNLVRAWQNGEEDPYMGITLKSSNETSVDKAFYATEYSTSSYRPYVTVTYDSDIELNKSVVDLAPNGTTTITADTAVSGGTITWSSSDTAIATVTKTGTNTCKITAVRSGIATITATLNNGPTASCTVYVSITNGVYFIKSGSMYLSVNGGMVEGSTLTLQTKKSSGPAQFRQLWKIQHIGQHYYSIRSLYRPDLALHAKDDGTVDMVSLNTSLSGTGIPLNRRWMISRTGSSYLFHFAGTSNLELRPQNDTVSAGNDVVVGFEANDTFAWALEWGPTVENQILLINIQNGLPATNAVRYVTPGKTITLTKMNLKAVYVSKTTNAQSFEWTSLSPSFATVQETTGAVTGVWEGQATIKVTNSESTKSPTYTIRVRPIPDGEYFIRNREHGRFLQVSDEDFSNDYSTTGAIMEQYPYDSGDYQKWQITLLNDGYYSIISVKSGLALSVPAGQTSSADVSLVQDVYNSYDRQKWEITQTEHYCYKLKPKSSEGVSNDLVMAVGDFHPLEPDDANIEQRNYVDDDEYRDEWQICSFVNIGMSTDDYSGDTDRKRGSYLYANTFYDEPGLYKSIPMSLTHKYNTESKYTATKNDFAVHGAMSIDTDFMIFIGHGHSVDLGDDTPEGEKRYNDRKYNHIQYSLSADKKEINSSSVCTESHDQPYKDRFCLYTDEVHFGSPASDLRWVWMYTCNFLHAREDNGDDDGNTANDNDYITNDMLAEMMTGAHIVMGYASASYLCEDAAYGFATYLREGIPFYDAFFMYGHVYESPHANDNHRQKIMYLDQSRYETIYSPQIHYEYDISDVVIRKRGIDEQYTIE